MAGHDSGAGKDRRNGVEDIPVPQERQYIVPVRTSVPKAEGRELGDVVGIRLAVDG